MLKSLLLSNMLLSSAKYVLLIVELHMVTCECVYLWCCLAWMIVTFGSNTTTIVISLLYLLANWRHKLIRFPFWQKLWRNKSIGRVFFGNAVFFLLLLRFDYLRPKFPNSCFMRFYLFKIGNCITTGSSTTKFEMLEELAICILYKMILKVINNIPFDIVSSTPWTDFDGEVG